MILLLLGPSGVGKSTILRELVMIDARYRPVQILTTRPLRLGETEKRSITVEEMAELDRNGDLLFVNNVYGVAYGTPFSEIDESLKYSRFPILDWPVDKLSVMRNQYGRKIFAAYLEPPSTKELERRLKIRGNQSIERLTSGVHELTELANGAFAGQYNMKICCTTNFAPQVAHSIHIEFCRYLGVAK